MSTSDQRQRAKSIRIPTNGPAIHAQVHPGTGPYLLLIHGISNSGFSWSPVIEDLGEHFTPLTIDLRGHGESAKPGQGYLYDDYIADLEAVIAYLALEPILIVGHSLGGIIGLWWAARHPDDAAAIVIEDSPLRSGQAFMPSFDQWIELNGMDVSSLREYYATTYPEWSDQHVDVRTRTMHETAPAVFSELRADSLAHHGVDRIAEITSIRSPVLLVHGDIESGSSVMPGDVEAFRSRLANARTVRIPGGNHSLHRDFREQFLAAAVPFLTQHASRQPAAAIRAG